MLMILGIYIVTKHSESSTFCTHLLNITTKTVHVGKNNNYEDKSLVGDSTTVTSLLKLQTEFGSAAIYISLYYFTCICNISRLATFDSWWLSYFLQLFDNCTYATLSRLHSYLLLLYHYLKYAIVIGPTRVTWYVEIITVAQCINITGPHSTSRSTVPGNITGQHYWGTWRYIRPVSYTHLTLPTIYSV